MTLSVCFGQILSQEARRQDADPRYSVFLRRVVRPVFNGPPG